MRKAVRKLDQYTAEANLMCKYKLKTLKDVKSYKEKSMNNLRDLYNKRSMNDGTKKDAVTEEIIKVTDKIKNTKKEIWYCNNIVERTNEVVENIKYIEEKWKKKMRK